MSIVRKAVKAIILKKGISLLQKKVLPYALRKIRERMANRKKTGE